MVWCNFCKDHLISVAVMAQRLLQMLGVWYGTQHEKLQRIW